MITQTGTLDSFSANKYGVGINLNLSKIENCIEEITKLNLSKIKEMKENFNKIDDNCFVITDDYDNTNIFLNKIIA